MNFSQTNNNRGDVNNVVSRSAHPIDMDAYRLMLTQGCERYEKTAPTVEAHLNDLYVRIGESPEKVTLAELTWVANLWSGGWAQPNYAANAVYKIRQQLGMDTTGYAGF